MLPPGRPRLLVPPEAIGEAIARGITRRHQETDPVKRRELELLIRNAAEGGENGEKALNKLLLLDPARLAPLQGGPTGTPSTSFQDRSYPVASTGRVPSGSLQHRSVVPDPSPGHEPDRLVPKEVVAKDAYVAKDPDPLQFAKEFPTPVEPAAQEQNVQQSRIEKCDAGENINAIVVELMKIFKKDLDEFDTAAKTDLWHRIQIVQKTMKNAGKGNDIKNDSTSKEVMLFVEIFAFGMQIRCAIDAFHSRKKPSQ